MIKKVTKKSKKEEVAILANSPWTKNVQEYQRRNLY